MKKTQRITKLHIAPCGMNCHLCMGFLREKNKCLGCNGAKKDKLKGYRDCSITKCVQSKNIRYCFECDTSPCARIKHLDNRYQTKYEMSMIKNLEYIKKNGIQKFVKHEKKRWVKGAQIYCIHHHKYY